MQYPRILAFGIGLAMLCVLVAPALAQESRDGASVELPYARTQALPGNFFTIPRLPPIENGLPNVMVTGYWPPTNEMLRPFSTNPAQNPTGWVGENWEGRGYNVYAYFPEFPGGTGSNPKGNGDFEVDYQDTSNDFWPLADLLQPIAIISFGRSGNDIDWELEGANRRYTTTSYSADYLAPTRPTAELPFYNEPVNTERVSTLPLQAIVDAVNASSANVYPYFTTYDESRFVCSFMGYHSNWYHALHSDPNDPAWNAAAGFIHLGYAMTLADAMLATEVTVRTTLIHVDSIRPSLPGDLDGDHDRDLDDFLSLAGCLTGPEVPISGPCALATLDGDADSDLADIRMFQIGFTGQ